MGACRAIVTAGEKRRQQARGGDAQVVDGLMYVLSTGCQWREIPKDLPPRATVHGYFDLWAWDGTMDRSITGST